MLSIQCAKEYILLNRRSIVLFPIMGALSAFVYFGLFTLFWHIWGVDYRVAVTVAYSIATFSQFFCNRRFTFRSHTQQLLGHFLKYLAMLLINYTITMVVVHIVVERLGFLPPVGVVAGIVVTMISGYFLSRYWVFVIK